MPRPPDSVRIGAVEADLDGVDLRYVRVAGHQVVDRLYVALRDETWATVPASITVLERSVHERTLRLVWEADHAEAGLPLSWRGALEVDEGGLSLSVEARAQGPIAYNRFGICVLHPLAQRGGDVVMDPAPGFDVHGADRAVLPVDVAPQLLGPAGPLPVFGPFTALDITAGGQRVRWTFEGDVFETEDQRNWTDASFKTYSTPLALPRPHRIEAGATLRQVVRATWGPAPAERLGLAVNPAAGADDLRDASGAPMELGALVPAGRTLSAHEAAVLVDRVGGSFVRLECRLRAGDVPPDVTDLSGSASAGRAAGAQVELTVLLEDGWSADHLAVLVESVVPRTVWLVVADAPSGAAGECTPRDAVARARDVLPQAVAVGGGTLFNFCELHRHRLDHLDELTFALCPTVHAADERSIRQTPASIPDIVRTARRLRPGATIEVGPLVSAQREPTLVGRDTAEPALDPGRLPPEWVGDMLRALDAAGADRVCALALDALVAEGELTAWGREIAGYASRRGRSRSGRRGGVA